MKKKLEERFPFRDGVFVDSAGIGSWHEGQLPDRRMREHGARRGYDICSRARQIRREDFAKFDYIFGMDHENMADLKRMARTDEERGKMTELLAAGFTDSFRYLYPDKRDAYSWWSFRAAARERNVGWRIDYFICSDRLRERIADAKIYPEVMGSDHCPVGLELR